MSTEKIELLISQVAEKKNEAADTFYELMSERIESKLDFMKQTVMKKTFPKVELNLAGKQPIETDGKEDTIKIRKELNTGNKNEKSKVKAEPEGFDESVSRKDFKLAADTIKQIPDMKDRQSAANLHAQIYAKSNPRFDHHKFHAACGTVA